MITKAMLDNWFTHHPPGEEDIEAYQEIRDAAKTFAQVIVKNTPACADQTVAIRKIRETIFVANAARACHQEDVPDDPNHFDRVEIDKDGNVVPKQKNR